MYYIGVDLGTSAVKLLLMNEKGEIQKITSREYPLEFPHPGWSQQNPADWYEQSMDGLKELLAECDKSQVAGISFGGQMHGLVVLDAQDEVIRPAILWNDGRTVKQVAYLNETIGKEKLSSYTANIAFAGFTAPKILWMKEEEPENFARIKKIMLPKDYLAYRLSGSFCTDLSDASGMLLLDVKHRTWSQEMLDICGITEEQLPKLYESYEVVGNLLPEVAQELGLSTKVKVIAGAGDNAAAAVGTGTVGDGACNISLGTSGTIFISSEHFGVDANNALHSFDHADGKYHLMGCMLSAASCNKWWMDDILQDKDYAGVQKDIQNLGENHVYFLPYLMGERSPHNDPLARACFVGMTMDTTRADMVQAVFEGVAFAMRDSLEVARSLGISLERTKICGGGAKSPLWCKIMANVLNLKVDLIAVEEGPALGGAMLAAVGCGEYASVEEAADAIVRVKETIEPEQDLVEKYEKRYDTFKQIYPAMKNIFPRM
jgi:xylulokinase